MLSPITLFVTIFAATAPTFAQSASSGTLTLGSDKFELRYAAATQVPDHFDKTKLATRIVLADKPIDGDILDDEVQIWDLKTHGYHGLELEITQDKSSYSLYVISPTLSGNFSRSGSLDPKRLTVFTAQRVEGALDSAPEETAGTVMGYSLKLAVNVTPPEPPPTPADAAAAAGKDSVKSYLALVDAIHSGNKQKIIALSPPDKRAAIDTPDFPKMLQMAQAMTPRQVQVLKAAESGDRAKLLARGVLEGEPQRGKIYLNRVNGQWILSWEAWSAW